MPNQDTQTQDSQDSLASNPFMGALQGMAQPQQQTPQSQQEQQPTFTANTDPIMEQFRQTAKDASEKYNNFQRDNQDKFSKLFNNIAFGVEPRAEIEKAKIQGRKLIGPQQEGVPPSINQYAPLTTGQKFKNFLKEWAMAYGQGARYQTVDQRSHEKALEDYKAEAGVSARDLQTLTYEQRGLASNALNSINDLQKGVVAKQKNDILQQRADIATAHQKAIEGMDVFKANQVTQRIQLMISQGREADAKAYAEKMAGGVNEKVRDFWATHDYPPNAPLQVLLQKHLDDGDVEGANDLANKMGLSRGLGQIQSGQFFTNDRGEATGFGITRGKNINQVIPAGSGNAGNQTPGQTQQIPSGAKTTLTPYNTDYGVPQKIPAFPDTKPEDLTIKNLYSYPMPMKVPAGVGTKVEAASTLLDRGSEFEALVNKLPKNALGFVMGNLNKIITGKITPNPNLGIAPADLNALRTVGSALALAHMGTQGIRSSDFATRIEDDINSWGADPETMFRGERGLTSQAYTLLQDNPSIAKKLIARKPGMTGEKFKEIFTSTPQDLANRKTGYEKTLDSKGLRDLIK